MTPGKWIPDLTPRTSLADAARRVLSLRLEVVREYLGLAVTQSEKDPEYIHQLRVGTRRAGAALDIFACCLTEKAHATARKHLRRLRRAAGAARDADVFLIELTDWASKATSRQRAAFDLLFGHSVHQRLLAQGQLKKASTKGAPFDSFLQNMLQAIHTPVTGPRRFGELAKPTLASLVGELQAAMAGDLSDYAHLHHVRIIGKRLRYAMEVFADCFPPEFKEKDYPAIEAMQEILGRANDSKVASDHLRSLREHLSAAHPLEWKRCKPGLERLLRFHEERLPTERERFDEWRVKEGKSLLTRLAMGK